MFEMEKYLYNNNNFNSKIIKTIYVWNGTIVLYKN